MATIKKIKKYQNSGSPIKPTKDSTAYFKKQGDMAAKEMVNATTPVAASVASNKIAAATKSEARQKNKGKKGYDANGFPIKPNKNGGNTKKATMKKGGTVKKSMAKMSKKK